MGFKIEDIVHPEAHVFARQFTCSVCLCILDDPVQTACDHIFCEACVSPRLACPMCMAAFAAADGWRPLRECNRPLQRMLHDLRVWCPYHCESKFRAPGPGGAVGDEEGPAAAKRARTQEGHCEWEGSYTDLLALHLRACLHHRVPCPRGCGETLRRMDLDAHAPACAKNYEACPICGEQVKSGGMPAHRAEKAELHVQLLEAKCAGLEAGKPHRESTEELRELVREEVAKQCQRWCKNLSSKVCWTPGKWAQLMSELPKGQSLPSGPLYFAGFGPFTLFFYPNGTSHAKAGASSIRLAGPSDVGALAKVRCGEWHRTSSSHPSEEMRWPKDSDRLGWKAGPPIPDILSDELDEDVEITLELTCVTHVVC